MIQSNFVIQVYFVNKHLSKHTKRYTYFAHLKYFVQIEAQSVFQVCSVNTHFTIHTLQI